MPVKRRTLKKRSRRGGSLKDWAMKGHKFMRSKKSILSRFIGRVQQIRETFCS
jgi:hypothetical protein